MSTQNFVRADLFRSNEVLHPKLRNGKVAHFADAAPTANANGGRAVCMDLRLKFNPEVSCDALEAQRLAKTAHYCAQLGLAATERDALLSAGPVLEQMGAQHYRSPTGAQPCGDAACEVGVSKHAKLRARLPRVLVYDAAGSGKVSRNAR